MLIYLVQEEKYSHAERGFFGHKKPKHHSFFEIDSLDIDGDGDVLINGNIVGKVKDYEKLAICQSAGFIPVILNGEMVLGKVVNLVKQKEDGVVNE